MFVSNRETLQQIALQAGNVLRTKQDRAEGATMSRTEIKAKAQTDATKQVVGASRRSATADVEVQVQEIITAAVKKVHTRRSTKPVEPVAPTAADTIKSLTESGRQFMTLVGLKRFDFFDEGIIEGGGNWGENMSWQAAKMMEKSPRSISGIMSRLASADLGLWIHSEEEGHSEDGNWWSLTALGAEVANTLAAVTVEPEPTPEPAPKATRRPKATVATPAAAPATAVPDEQTKAKAYIEAATAEGWTTEVESDAVNKSRLLIIAKRGDETILITFIDNKMDASQMPMYIRADCSRVLLRNASAAKKQMSADPVKRVIAPVLLTHRSTAEPVTVDEPRRSLPFDPATATDDEIVEHFSSGVRVVWRNSISKTTDTTIVPPRTKVRIAEHPRAVGPQHRVVSFISITGQIRNVGLDRLLRANRLSPAKAIQARKEFLAMYSKK